MSPALPLLLVLRCFTQLVPCVDKGKIGEHS